MSARTMSGGAASSFAIAWSPSLTATTLMSSSANVSSITRWIVTLSSASKSVCGTLDLSDGKTALCSSGAPHLHARSRVRVDEVDDFLHRRPGQEDPFHADSLQLGDVHVGDDSPDQHEDIVEPPVLQELHEPRRNV